MFSGIVEITTEVVSVEALQGGRRVTLLTPRGWRLQEGESVCVDGVCSTVQNILGATSAKSGRGKKTANPPGGTNPEAFQVIYMPETLRRSTLGGLTAGSRVNLERSLTLRARIGGHLLQGHIDAVGRIAGARKEGSAVIYEFRAPRPVLRYVVEKGSIAVDGISLTVTRVRADGFAVSLLAYTLSHTTLGGKRRGGRVNLEADMIAKYVEKLLAR